MPAQVAPAAGGARPYGQVAWQYRGRLDLRPEAASDRQGIGTVPTDG